MSSDKKSSKQEYVAIPKNKKDINLEVLELIKQERSGKQLGLLTRFPTLNKAFNKYLRFGRVFLIAALSGHGKSTFLTMLLEDFKNKKLNGKYEEDVVICHNSFEMLPVDERLRVISNKVELSTAYILSSETTSSGYNKLTEEEYNKIEQYLEEEIEDYHYYFDEPVNVKGVLINALATIQSYVQKKAIETGNNESDIKPPKLIVAIDHTLLVENNDNDSTLDTMTLIGKAAIYLKKKGHLVILIGQLNNEIEKPERLKNPLLQYPMKSDIYAQAQIYNACDIVAIIHQPEMIGIVEYGKNKYPTERLIHFQIIKQRFGKIGSIWLINLLNKGIIVETDSVSLLNRTYLKKVEHLL